MQPPHTAKSPIDRQKLKFNGRADVMCDLTDDEYAITALADFLAYSPGAFATIADVTLKEQLYNYLPEKSRHVSLPLTLLDVIRRYPHILQVITCDKENCFHVKLTNWECNTDPINTNMSFDSLMRLMDEDSIRLKVRQTIKFDTTVELSEFLALFEQLWGHPLQLEEKIEKQQQKNKKQKNKKINTKVIMSTVDIIRRVAPECTLFSGLIRFRSNVKPCRQTPFDEVQVLRTAIALKLRPVDALTTFQGTFSQLSLNNNMTTTTSMLKPIVDHSLSFVSPMEQLPDELSTAILIHNMLFNSPGLITRVSTLPKLFEICYNRRLPDALLVDTPFAQIDSSISSSDSASSTTSSLSTLSQHNSYAAITQLLRKYNDLFFVRESRYHDCHLDIVGSAFWTIQFGRQYGGGEMSYNTFNTLLEKNDSEVDLKTKLSVLVKTGSRYTGKEIRILYLLIWRHRLQGPVMWDLLKRCGDILTLENSKAKGSNIIVSRKENLARGNQMVVNVDDIVRLELTSRRMKENPSLSLSKISTMVEECISKLDKSHFVPMDVSTRYPVNTYRRSSTSPTLSERQSNTPYSNVAHNSLSSSASSVRRYSASSPTESVIFAQETYQTYPQFTVPITSHHQQLPQFFTPQSNGNGGDHHMMAQNMMPMSVVVPTDMTYQEALWRQQQCNQEQQYMQSNSIMNFNRKFGNVQVQQPPSAVDNIVERVVRTDFFKQPLITTQQQQRVDLNNGISVFSHGFRSNMSPLTSEDASFSPFVGDYEDPANDFERPRFPTRGLPSTVARIHHPSISSPRQDNSNLIGSKRTNISMSAASLSLYRDAQQTLDMLGLNPWTNINSEFATSGKQMINPASLAWDNNDHKRALMMTPTSQQRQQQQHYQSHRQSLAPAALVELDLFECFRPRERSVTPLISGNWGISGAVLQMSSDRRPNGFVPL